MLVKMGEEDKVKKITGIILTTWKETKEQAKNEREEKVRIQKLSEGEEEREVKRLLFRERLTARIRMQLKDGEKPWQ
jgi:hypothetical protein